MQLTAYSLSCSSTRGKEALRSGPRHPQAGSPHVGPFDFLVLPLLSLPPSSSRAGFSSSAYHWRWKFFGTPAGFLFTQFLSQLMVFPRKPFGARSGLGTPWRAEASRRQVTCAAGLIRAKQRSWSAGVMGSREKPHPHMHVPPPTPTKKHCCRYATFFTGVKNNFGYMCMCVCVCVCVCGGRGGVGGKATCRCRGAAMGQLDLHLLQLGAQVGLGLGQGSHLSLALLKDRRQLLEGFLCAEHIR